MVGKPALPRVSPAEIEPSRGQNMRRRLKSESGIALVMAVGVMTVLMIAGSAVVFYAGSNARSSEHSADNAKAVHLGEAGMNYARAILWHSGSPDSASAVPSCSTTPLPQLTLEGGTVTYCGTYDSAAQTWTLTGTGTYTNPTGGTAPISRTVSSQVQVTTSSSFEPAWGYLFADTASLCTNLKNTIEIDAPIYVRGDLCMENSAVITSELVRVRGKVDIKDSASIGTVADTVDQVEVGGDGCRYPWGGQYFSPCGSDQKVYRIGFSNAPQNIPKPPNTLLQFYTEAMPGPTTPCSPGYSFPGTFDQGGGGMNRSNPTQYLFPNSAYDCQVKDGNGNLLGRIAYTPGNPGTLIIDGVVFFDGKLELQGSTNVVYQGRGSIYASDEIKIQSNVTLCGIAGCTTSWDPDVNILHFFGGAASDTGVLIENNTTFQGAIYAVNDYLQKNDTNVCGPVIAQELKIENGTENCYVPFTTLAPGMPGSSGSTVVTLMNVPDSFTTS
jgi:Tfp pilus assembly protein PilX